MVVGLPTFKQVFFKVWRVATKQEREQQPFEREKRKGGVCLIALI